MNNSKLGMATANETKKMLKFYIIARKKYIVNNYMLKTLELFSFHTPKIWTYY